MPSIVNTAMLNAFLDEYIDFRTRTIWNTWTGSSVYAYKKLTSLTSSSATINVDDKSRRTAECTSLKNRFEILEKLEDWFDVIDEIAVLARKAQSEKTVAGDSEFALTLHAVRTLIIASILNSPQYQPIYLAKIEAIKAERAAIESEIKSLQNAMTTKIKQRVDITAIEKKSDAYKEELNKKYQLLLDMQDPDTIIDARITKHFARESLPKSEDIPNLPFAQTINPNIPLFYHLNFFNIFYSQEIGNNRERNLYFLQQMRSPSKLVGQQGVDIMDPHFSQQMDESILQLPNMPDFTQLFNKAVAAVVAPFVPAPNANADENVSSNEEVADENKAVESNDASSTKEKDSAEASASSSAPSEPAPKPEAAESSSVAQMGHFAPQAPAKPAENEKSVNPDVKPAEHSKKRQGKN